jgi:hypothetical protein
MTNPSVVIRDSETEDVPLTVPQDRSLRIIGPWASTSAGVEYLVAASRYAGRPIDLQGAWKVVTMTHSPTASIPSSALGEPQQLRRPRTQVVTVLNPGLGAIPSWRTALEKTIHDSTWIQDLADDWDGEGSPGISRTTWERGVYFLRQIAERAGQVNRVLPLPSINPNGHGSVDVFWNMGERSLLLNIPASSEESPSYSTIAGTRPPRSGLLDSRDALDLVTSFLTTTA